MKISKRHLMIENFTTQQWLNWFRRPLPPDVGELPETLLVVVLAIPKKFVAQIEFLKLYRTVGMLLQN